MGDETKYNLAGIADAKPSYNLEGIADAEKKKSPNDPDPVINPVNSQGQLGPDGQQQGQNGTNSLPPITLDPASLHPVIAGGYEAQKARIAVADKAKDINSHINDARTAAKTLNEKRGEIGKTTTDMSFINNDQTQQLGGLYEDYKNAAEKDKPAIADKIKTLETQPFAGRSINVPNGPAFTVDPVTGQQTQNPNYQEVPQQMGPATYTGDDKGVPQVKTVGDAYKLLVDKNAAARKLAEEAGAAKAQYDHARDARLDKITLEPQTGFWHGVELASTMNARSNQISKLAQSGADEEAIKQLNEYSDDLSFMQQKAQEQKVQVSGVGQGTYNFYNSMIRPIAGSIAIGAAGSAVGAPALGAAYISYDAGQQGFTNALISKYQELQQGNPGDPTGNYTKAKQYAFSEGATSALVMATGSGVMAGVEGISGLRGLANRAFSQGLSDFGAQTGERGIVGTFFSTPKALQIAPRTFAELRNHALGEGATFAGLEIAKNKYMQGVADDLGIKEPEATDGAATFAAFPVLMNAAMYAMGKGKNFVMGEKNPFEKLPQDIKNNLVMSAATYNPDVVEEMLNKGVGNGVIRPEQKAALSDEISATRNAILSLPNNLDVETLKKAVPTVIKIQANEKAMALADAPAAVKEAAEWENERLTRKLHEDLGTPLSLDEEQTLEELKSRQKEKDDEGKIKKPLTPTEKELMQHLEDRAAGAKKKADGQPEKVEPATPDGTQTATQQVGKDANLEGDKGVGAQGAGANTITVGAHADIKDDENNLVSGRNGKPLTEAGRKQADAEAEKPEVKNATVLVGSGEARSEETVKRIADLTGAKTESNSNLNTLDVGGFGGMKEDEFAPIHQWFVEHPDERVYTPENKDDPNYGKEMGESINQAAERVAKGVEEVKKNYPGEQVHIVTHGYTRGMIDAIEKNGGWNDAARKAYAADPRPDVVTIDKSAVGSRQSAKSKQKTAVGFAPLRSTQVSTPEEDAAIRNSPGYKTHQQLLEDAAEALGIKIIKNTETWGGWVDTETGKPVQEASNLIHIEATPEQARQLAAVLGSGAPEEQNGVMIAHYDPNGSGTEHIIGTGSFEEAQKALDYLKQNNISNFTVDKNTGDIIIVDADDSNQENITNFVEQIRQNGITGKYEYAHINAEFPEQNSFAKTIEGIGGSAGSEKGRDIADLIGTAKQDYADQQSAANGPQPATTGGLGAFIATVHTGGETAPDAGEPKPEQATKGVKFWNTLQNIFSGLQFNHLKSVSPEAYAAAVKYANSTAQAAVMLRKAAVAVESAGGKGAWQNLKDALMESRLRGIEQRWKDMAGAALKTSRPDLDAQFDGTGGTAPILHILDSLNKKEEFSGEDLRNDALALLAKGDYKGLRNMLSDVFSFAGDNTAHHLTPEEYDAAVNKPDFDKGLEIYKQTVEKPVEENHASNEGVFSTSKGPLDTYYPLIPKDMQEAQSRMRIKSKPLTGPQNRSNAFATGLSKAYDNSSEALLGKLKGAIRANNKAGFIQALEDNGIVQKLGKNDPEPTHISVGGGFTDEAKVVSLENSKTIINDGQKIQTPSGRVVMPKSLYNEAKDLLEGKGDDRENAFAKVSGWFTKGALMGYVEAGIHAQNLMSGVVNGTPFLGTRLDSKAGRMIYNAASINPITKAIATFYRGLTYDVSSPAAIERLNEKAQAGIISPKTGTTTFSKAESELTGAKLARPHLGDFSPILYGNKGIDVKMRALMDDVLQTYKPDASVAERLAFQKNLGIYNTQLEGRLAHFMKNTGLSPFYTAASTFYKQGIKSQIGANPLPMSGLSPAKKAMLVGTRLLGSSAVGMLGSWMMAYHLQTGKWPWEDKESKLMRLPFPEAAKGTRIGDIFYNKQSGTYDDINFGFFNETYARGLKAIGADAAYNTRNQGGTTGQDVEKGFTQAVNSGMAPFIGSPLLHFGFEATTGSNPFLLSLRDDKGRMSPKFFRDVKTMDPGLPQIGANIAQAGLDVNPIVKKISTNTGYNFGPKKQEANWWNMITAGAFPRLQLSNYPNSKAEPFVKKEAAAIKKTEAKEATPSAP